MSVYFARVGDYMKIGLSKDPIARSATLTYMKTRPENVSRGDAVELVGWFPGSTSEERAAHMRFGPQHVIGEWFIETPEMTDYLESNPRAIVMSKLTLGAMRLIAQGVPAAEAYAAHPPKSMD